MSRESDQDLVLLALTHLEVMKGVGELVAVLDPQD
jgi:hypothetical protein